jgi:quercetin dioxygenase-like cupin family protein
MHIATRAADARRPVSWMGTTYTITVTKGDSGGLLGVFESTTPVGEGPPVHIHNNEDEVIHVIEGAFEFWLDGHVSRAGPGMSVFLPRGVPHTFRVTGDRPGRILALTTPGGFENFFIEAAERNLRIPDNMPELMELAGRYGLEFIGPANWDG